MEFLLGLDYSYSSFDGSIGYLIAHFLFEVPCKREKNDVERFLRPKRFYYLV